MVKIISSMRNVYVCTWLLLMGIGIPTDSLTGICELPEAWSGSWYENGVRQQIEISGLKISHKGTCVRSRHSTQFIFKDKLEGCMRCLSIHSKHKNILQYKESKCILQQGRNHKHLCHSISVDEPLKTMFRIRAESQECPIKGHYTFSYSRGYGQCLYPLSSLSHCGNATSLIFRFQACPDIKGTESAVRMATCTASWREGSTNYFVARLSSSQSGNRELETNFRCFVYKSVYTGYEVAMSAAGECNLYSASEGQTTFNLERVLEPELGCKYPEWSRKHSQYISLHGSTHIHIDHNRSILTLREANMAPKTGGSEGLIAEETYYRNLQCTKIVDVSSNVTRMVTLSTEHCWSGFQCVELERVSDDVMVLRVGKITFSPEDACSQNLYFSNTKPVLITGADIKAKSCPMSGQYRITPTTTTTNEEGVLSVQPVNQGTIILPSINTPVASAATHRKLLQAAADDKQEVSATLLTKEGGEPDPLSGSSTGSDGAKCPSVVSSCGNPYTLSFSNQCTNYGKEYTCYDSWQVDEGKMVILSPTNHSLNRFCILLREEKDRFKLEVLPQCTLNKPANPVNFHAVHYGDCSPTALATANQASIVTACLTIYLYTLVIAITTLTTEVMTP